MFRSMCHAERLLAGLAVVSVVLVSAQASIDDNEYAKEKRAGVLRLFPFPRVGRSDPGEAAAAAAASNWDNNYMGFGAGGNGNDNWLSAGNGGGGGYGGSFEEYDTDLVQLLEPHQSARAGARLSPFARSGRSGAGGYTGGRRYVLPAGAKRAGAPGSANGMWFGPRLGRVQKRTADLSAASQLATGGDDH